MRAMSGLAKRKRDSGLWGTCGDSESKTPRIARCFYKLITTIHIAKEMGQSLDHLRKLAEAGVNRPGS